MAKSDEILREIGVLGEKVISIEKYLIERNNLQDKRIETTEKDIKKNSIAVASIKGVAIGVSFIVTVAINAVMAFFTFFKGGHA